MDAKNYMDEFRTITGITLTEALRGLVEILPPNAYKEVKGKSGKVLTDIDPSYFTQVMTQLFGLAGVGWYYNYYGEPKITSEVRTNAQKTREYTMYTCTIDHLDLMYRYIDSDGKMHWSEPVVGNGGTSNENIEWALKGALTNALGGAAKQLCWQLLVFQGKLDHTNANAKYKAQQERQLEIETEPVKEEVIPASKAGLVNNAPTPEQVSDALETVEWARTVVIPANMGIPFAGKPLSAAMATKPGKQTIQWLAGEAESNSKGKFKPTVEQKSLHRAAVVLWTELNSASE